MAPRTSKNRYTNFWLFLLTHHSVEKRQFYSHFEKNFVKTFCFKLNWFHENFFLKWVKKEWNLVNSTLCERKFVKMTCYEIILTDKQKRSISHSNSCFTKNRTLPCQILSIQVRFRTKPTHFQQVRSKKMKRNKRSLHDKRKSISRIFYTHRENVI